MRYYQDSQGNLHAIEDNSRREAIPDWVALSEAEAETVLHPPLTPEQIQSQLEAVVDAHINATAQADGWDSRITCVLRAGYVNPWQAKGVAFGEWMDACLVYCYQVQDDVLSSIRPLPTEAELIAELPVMIWP